MDSDMRWCDFRDLVWLTQFFAACGVVFAALALFLTPYLLIDVAIFAVGIAFSCRYMAEASRDILEGYS